MDKDFISLQSADSGGAISHTSGTMDYVTGDFVNNTAASDGGAIYNYSSRNNPNVTIGDVTGNFIANNAGNRGGAIYNHAANPFSSGSNFSTTAAIGNITGDFVANSAEVSGGAISNIVNNAYESNSGSFAAIGTIKGNFIGNSAGKNGGAIENTIDWVSSNYGNAPEVTIEEIIGSFIGNRAGADGGAIYNSAVREYGSPNVSIGNITGDFINNYASGSGGAIYNYYGKIGDITGDFIGNHASSSSSSANGGAIYNNYGTIGDITGDFIDNYAYSSSSSAYGGAIYNSGTIGSKDEDGNIVGGLINSSFINNYAKSESGTAQGGAIWTDADLNIIAKDGGQSVFTGNYTETNGVKTPNAIYVANPNYANTTINNITKDTVEYTVETRVNYDLPVLTLNANTNGVIVFNDTIDGDGSGTKVIHGDLVVDSYYQEQYGTKTVDEFVEYLKSDATNKPWWYTEGMTDEEILKEAYDNRYLESTNEQTISETLTDVYDLHLTGDETGAIYLNNEIKNADISIDTTNVYVN